MWKIKCQYNINSSANQQPLSLEDLVWILFDMRSNFINLGVFVGIIVPTHTENFYFKGTVEIHAHILNVFVIVAPFCCLVHTFSCLLFVLWQIYNVIHILVCNNRIK